MILVDSGSIDDTVAIAQAHGAEVVHISPAEFSFGRALNLGCAAASGDILVIVSAHVYPLDEKWLDLLVAPFERPEVGLVYGGQTGDSRSHFSELELLRTWFPDVSDDDQQTPFCNNANCAVRAEAWRALPYDETLTGLEDLDWAKRALAAGWKLVYARRGPGRPHPQRAVRQDAQPLPARGDRPPADLPRPARQPVRGARVVPAVDRPRLPRRRRPPAAVVEPDVDPQVPRRPVPRHVGGVPPPRRRLDVAAPPLLLPEGVHRPRPVLAGRPMSLSVVAFVPMRHSSERVPGKNYRPFNGVPLFHRIVSTLLAVERITKVVIDTDSPTVKEQAADAFPSVEVIDRPDHLLGGHTPMTDVLRYDAEQVPSEWYLQTHTTNPLLRPETIDAALDRMEHDADEHDSLFSVTRWQTRLYAADGTPINHDPDVLLRTQDLPPVYEENSNLYLFTADQIAAGRRIGKRPILFEIDPLEAVDIDEETDFVLAEALDRHLAAQR